MALSEEEKVIQVEQDSDAAVITAYNRIPYTLISREVEGPSSDLLAEMTEICKYYRIYKKGKAFTVEGTHGDYVPATLRYKMVATLINKEARFLFAEAPDIVVEPKGDAGQVTEEAKGALTTINDLIKTIFDKNSFEDALLKGSKDCFIGKRVAMVANFNEEDGVTITFLPATQFVYQFKVGSNNVLEKFVCFIVVRDSSSQADKRIFMKKYILGEDGFVWLEEKLFDGAGTELETSFEFQPTLMRTIPAVVVTNDGLTGDIDGESEVELLADYEEWYSKLSNGDKDAERKSMNPIRYTVDMDTNSTKNLSSSAGSHWDLGSDQNLEEAHPMVGMLEPSMKYSEALKTTLERIKTSGYEQVDMPSINPETMTGVITSGKALKAIYWPLIVRCKEKMKTWRPALRKLVDILIEGAMAYPNCIVQYTDDVVTPVAYEVKVEQNTPLPEDEVEEKNMDLSEVESKTMSRKAYMKKWRQLTDDEVDEELQQIALEREIIEDSYAPSGGSLTRLSSLRPNTDPFEVVE